MHLSVSNPSDFDPVAALTARLALLSDPDWTAPRPKYRHNPTVTSAQALYRVDGEYAPLRNAGGITKWMTERDQALKAKRAESINAFEMRRLAAQAKDDERVYRANLEQRKNDEAAEAGIVLPPKPPLKEHVLLEIQRRQTEANMVAYGRGKVARRWNQFGHKAGRMAGRDYAPFTEQFTLPDGTTTGLRSHNGSLSTARFSQLMPAVHRLAYGYDKERLLRTDMNSRKIFVLDMPYVELDSKRLGVLVVDLDTNWESEDVLRAALLEILGPTRIPNLIVYRWSEDGTELESPHLIWLLPPGSEVGTGGNSRQAPIHTFKKVQRGLVSLLIPLGADIGHHNPKIKNPLSPYWSILIDDSFFVDLTQWKTFLPKSNEDEMRRRAAIHQVTGVDGDLSQSNYAWNTVVDLIRAAIKNAVAIKCPTYAAAMATYASYSAWLLSAIKADAIKILDDVAVTHRILRRQVDWRARHRKVPKAEVSNRGRDSFVNRKGNVFKIAGSRTRQAQRKASVAAVAAVIRDTIAAGLPVVKSDIIKNVKTVSRPTAYRVYKDALDSVSDAPGYIAISLTAPCKARPLPALQVPSVIRVPVIRPRWHRRPVIRDRQPAFKPSRPRLTFQKHDPGRNAIAEHRSTVGHAIRNPGRTLH